MNLHIKSRIGKTVYDAIDFGADVNGNYSAQCWTVKFTGELPDQPGWVPFRNGRSFRIHRNAMGDYEAFETSDERFGTFPPPSFRRVEDAVRWLEDFLSGFGEGVEVTFHDLPENAPAC